MAEMKIGISGNVSAVKAAVQSITDELNKLGAASAKVKNVDFKPVGVDDAEKQLAQINRQFQAAVARSKTLRDYLRQTSQSASAGIANIDFSRLSGMDPREAQRIRDYAFRSATRNTAFDQTNVPVPPQGGGQGGGGGGGGGRRPPRDDDDDDGAWRRRAGRFAGRFGGAFGRGFGGPVAQIGSEAAAGAAAGAAEGGGIGGGALGLLKGLGVGTAIFGALKAGQMVSEGMDMAKERDLTLDTLKRQLGDLGISFEELQKASEQASSGLGVNAKEFAQLEQQFTTASHGVEQIPENIADETRQSTAFSRAYGLQPGEGANFFGSMRGNDPRQNNRELSLLIAEAINHSSGHALPGEVLQAIQSFAGSAARMSLSAPNVSGFAGAYAGMLAQGGAGMTPENASAILGRANAAVSNMGAAGEAGQNFILQAINEGGVVDPFTARAIAQGGLFGTRRSVFGEGDHLTTYGQFASDRGQNVGALLGSTPDRTLFESIRDKMEKEFQGRPQEMAAAMANLTGLNSQQSAALLQVMPANFGQLGGLLQKSGVDVSQVNAGGIATLARISGASAGGLQDVYSSMASRTDKGALTTTERQRLEAAKGGDPEQFRILLAQIAAGKDQEQTVATDARASKSALETIQIQIGEKLIPSVNTMRDALLSIGHKLAPEAVPDPDKTLVQQAAEARAAAQGGSDGSSGGPDPDYVDPAANATGVQAERFGKIADIEKKYDLPPGLLKGMWGAESTFGTNQARNPDTTAEGHFQFKDDTAAEYNVTRHNFESELSGAGRKMKDLLAKHNGDLGAALYDWNGVKRNYGVGNDFIDHVAQFGGVRIAHPRNADGSVASGNAQSSTTQSGGVDALVPGQVTSDMTITEVPADAKADPHAGKHRFKGKWVDDYDLKGFRADESIVDTSVPTSDWNDMSIVEEAAPSRRSRGKGRGGQGTEDTVNLNVSVDVNSRDGAGSTSKTTMKTHVKVPRGSGVRDVAVPS